MISDCGRNIQLPHHRHLMAILHILQYPAWLPAAALKNLVSLVFSCQSHVCASDTDHLQ